MKRGYVHIYAYKRLKQEKYTFEIKKSRVENEKGLCAYILYMHIAPFHSQRGYVHIYYICT